ncbi:MAG: hypothetical protein ACJ8BE_04275, partial [Microvirga sp.]
RAKLATELKAEAPDPATFRGIWIEPPRRRTLIDRLVARGLSARVLQEVEGMRDYDPSMSSPRQLMERRRARATIALRASPAITLPGSGPCRRTAAPP